MTWTPIELSAVRYGDTIRVEDGPPFTVHAVEMNPTGNDLSVYDHIGMHWFIRNTDRLERSPYPLGKLPV